jgi:hypothetical protein
LKVNPAGKSYYQPCKNENNHKFCPAILEKLRIYGTLSRVKNMIKIMLVRGIGIRDIRAVLKISITTVLKVLKSIKYRIKPKQSHYDRLEVDEFWTYAGKKKDKVWLIYAYHRESGEIAAFVWGKRDLKTAKN